MKFEDDGPGSFAIHGKFRNSLTEPKRGSTSSAASSEDVERKPSKEQDYVFSNF